MSIPPDRSWVLTEQRNPRSATLSSMSTADIVRTIQDEDRTVHVALERARPAIIAFIEAAEPHLARGGRVISLGAGTSGRLAVLDASEMPPTFHVDPNLFVGIIAGGDASLRRSSEGREDEPLGAVPELERLAVTDRDILLGVAAGGTTPYVRGALEWAAARTPAPLTALLTCAPVDPPRGVAHIICVETGPEVVTGSTRMKAGTATKLVLNTISTALMVRSGRVYQNLMVDLRASNDKLRDRAARIISTITALDRPAAFAALDAAAGDTKLAIVMVLLCLDAPTARQRLEAAGGRLDRLIDKK